jgi:hypothetical protein
MSYNIIRANSNKIAVDPLHGLIIKMFGSLAFACVVSGGLTCVLNFGAKTGLDIFGIHMTTTSVGIAFMAIGVFTAYFAVRIVLKSRRDLEQLRRNRRTLTRVARSKARRPNAAARDTSHRRRMRPKVVDSASTTPDHPRI